MQLDRIYREAQAAALFPALGSETVLGHDKTGPVGDLFFLADECLGFGFECTPLHGVSDTIAARVEVLLQAAWPAGTIIQYCLYASPHVGPILADTLKRRADLQDGPLRDNIEARVRFLAKGADTPLSYTGTPVRDFRLVVTVKVPTGGPLPSEQQEEEAKKLAAVAFRLLRTATLRPQWLNASSYLAFMQTVLNGSPHATWRRTEVQADRDKPLRNQILDFDTDIGVDSHGLWLGDHARVRTISPKQLPAEACFGLAMRYLGDLDQGARGLRDRFLLTATVEIPDQFGAKKKVERARAWVNRMAYGPLLRAVPGIAVEKADHDELAEKIDAGKKVVKLTLTLAMFSPDDQKSIDATANAISYFGEMAFTMLPDRFVVLPIFLNALPFGADPKGIADLWRANTMSATHAVKFLPILADWKGSGTPRCTFLSRNGQIQSVDNWDSNTNFNVCIAAPSGSGKSFLTNEMITSTLSMGGRVWVFDVGYSYKKICKDYGGEFLEFAPDEPMCLNPFPLIQDWNEEADVIASLMTAMAAPTQPLSDLEREHLVRVLRETWETKHQDMVIDHVEEALLREEDQRIKDIGHRLFSFTSKGEFGRFFNGPNTVKFDNNFVVLELERLKSRKRLQTVALLQLIFQIQQEMYLGDRSQQKMTVVDEAWDLMASDAAAPFIEHGARRFRKYNGAIITATQGVEDYYQSKAGEALIRNSASLYLLEQKPDAILALQEQKRLAIGEGGFRLLSSVHTARGEYSEIFFITGRGGGIGRLVVDPWRQLLYSTHADDVGALEALQASGMTLKQAIDELVRRSDYV